MIGFTKILVVFDSEEKDGAALRLAFRLARDSGGSLTVAHIIPPLPPDLPHGFGALEDLEKTLVHASENTLKTAVKKLPVSDVPVDTLVLWGHPAMELSRIVLQQGHDLVMKATGGKPGISGKLLGSVDMRILRKCPCPVWLVKPGAHGDVHNILAAVDPTSSEESHRQLNDSILRLGAALAKMEGAELQVLHAWSAWGGHLMRSRMRSDQFTDYVGRMRARAAKALSELLRPLDDLVPLLNRHLVEGEPEDVVPEFVRSKGIDVVVMGTVVRTGVPGFLIGNTAEMILGEVECSVLAVKPEGFATPVEL